MTVLLVGVAVYTILGGMLSVLVTDFLQFVVMSAGLIAVTILILYKVGWDTIVETVEIESRRRRVQSVRQQRAGLVVRGFQCVSEYGGRAHLANHDCPRAGCARYSRPAARFTLGRAFSSCAGFLIPGLWGIAALAIDRRLAESQTMEAMPRYLGQTVPAGLMGLLIAAMLAADMSTDSSYMLTWGSVIYNDIMAPFRRTQWSDARASWSIAASSR